MITWLICVWLLRYKKGLILAPSSPLGKSCHAVIYFRKKKENHVHSKLLFLFFTSSTYLISVSFLLFIHLTLFIQTLLTNHESSLPLTHHQPQPLQKNPTTPPWLVKTYVKSYFPLIKYSSVLQMYAWITCHTLSLLRMAPRWCS